MKITVIFDSVSARKDLSTGWGVSFIINDKVLFDTGEKGAYLIKNLSALKINTGAIESAVISHDHWDHQGGLWALLEKTKHLKVYACPGFSKEFKARVSSGGGRLIEAGAFTKIAKDVYITGEIAGEYASQYMPEQALVLKTRRGLAILTGCAHPGIIKIIENVRKNTSGTIYLVGGGFHLIDSPQSTVASIIEKFRCLEVKKVAPLHCTGKEAAALFKEAYGDDFIEAKAGQTIVV